MNLSSRAAARIVTLCVTMLLLAQTLGLHHHRHVELDRAGGSHPVQLHFEDSGLHDEAGHGHHAVETGGGETEHPHLDVESKVVGEGLVKAFVDLLQLGVGLTVLLLRLPPTGHWRPALRLSTAPSRRPAYALRPPSQAPPLSLVTA